MEYYKGCKESFKETKECSQNRDLKRFLLGVDHGFLDLGTRKRLTEGRRAEVPPKKDCESSSESGF